MQTLEFQLAMRLQPSSGLWLPGTKRKLQQESGLLSLMPGSAGWRQRVLSAVSRSMCCREVAGRGGRARRSSGPTEDVRAVGFTGGTATCQRRSRPRQCFRLPTPLAWPLSQACTCSESGERVPSGLDCGPPSPSPECTAIPSAGMMPSGLSCRLRGRAQGQDMSYSFWPNSSAARSHRYEAFPILYMPVLHTGQVPRVAGRPFFIVTCSAF